MLFPPNINLKSKDTHRLKVKGWKDPRYGGVSGSYTNFLSRPNQNYNQTDQEKKREDSKVRNERGEITTDTKEIQRIVRKILLITLYQQTGQPG